MLINIRLIVTNLIILILVIIIIVINLRYTVYDNPMFRIILRLFFTIGKMYCYISSYCILVIPLLNMWLLLAV